MKRIYSVVVTMLRQCRSAKKFDLIVMHPMVAVLWSRVVICHFLSINFINMKTYNKLWIVKMSVLFPDRGTIRRMDRTLQGQIVAITK
jgi:hypothetical protein